MTVLASTRRIRRTLLAAASLGAGILAAPLQPAMAQTQTLTFEDVATPSNVNNNFRDYRGFTFFGFNVATSAVLGSGANAVSGERFALGRDDLSAIYREGPSFNFFDAWLSFRQFAVVDPIDTPVGVNVLGYREGEEEPVFSQVVLLTGTAQRFTFDFRNVEEVVFETDALTADGRTAAIALDDARLAVVPEPASLMLLATGGVLLLFVARRKRRTR